MLTLCLLYRWTSSQQYGEKAELWGTTYLCPHSSLLLLCSIAIEWPKVFKDKIGLYKSISDRQTDLKYLKCNY